ncbi:LPS export ABC transporter periplasmic protein LptC [Candidatus Magnetaquicoccus inordinatus]|uniref:LPS export ABC transporter periplasmic protein LptC n=1 Tax=Candidatus Magnetaquicoccus inordinatus TaxID=2496818 RepID=UPI00102D28EC|nr:LPS export ABC transporter periplasmic protein LptC [Candidatus Magnetaquicoccus inordinatus]
MKLPVKLFMVTIPLLVLGLVAWHLQHPNRVMPGRDPCANDSSMEKSAPGCLANAAEVEIPATATKVTEVQLFQLVGERLQWRLLAPSALDEGKDKIFIRQPDLLLYNEEGERSVVTAQEGSVHQQTQIMTFSGQVVANSERQRLTSELLHYDPARKMLYTQQPFVLEDDTMRLEGVGLAIMNDKKSMIVQHNVRLHTFTVRDEVTGDEDDETTPRS